MPVKEVKNCSSAAAMMVTLASGTQGRRQRWISSTPGSLSRALHWLKPAMKSILEVLTMILRFGTLENKKSYTLSRDIQTPSHPFKFHQTLKSFYPTPTTPLSAPGISDLLHLWIAQYECTTALPLALRRILFEQAGMPRAKRYVLEREIEQW